MSTPPPPPAGIVERQIEAEYEAEKIDAEKEIPLLEIDLPEKQLVLSGETVHIKRITFSGNEIIPSRELDKVVQPYLNRDLSMQDIREMCLAIQAKYVKEGYFLTRSCAPEQQINDGILQLMVIEGKLGEVTVVGNKYYSEKYIKSYFQKLQGQPINYDAMLKALLLLDENSDMNAGAVFKKGKEFGTADVIIRISDQRPIHLYADHNNYGSDHTSRHRTGAKLDYGSLFMYGDTLSVTEVVGSPISSLDFTDIIYRCPINSSGSYLDFSFLLAEFKTDKFDKFLRFEGRSHIGTVRFSQALARTRRLNTDIFTSFDYKQIKNYSNKVGTTSFDKLRILNLGGSFDYIDGWQGRNLFVIWGSWGIPNFMGGLHAEDSRCSRVGAGGEFLKANGGYKRLQKMPYNTFLLFNCFAQGSLDKLPLPEQIYIGGIDTVRGYKLAKGLGDQGFYTNIELRVPLPFIRSHKVPFLKKTWGEFLQFVGFLDHGQTFVIGRDKIRQGEVGPDGKPEKGKVNQHGRSILTAVGPGVRVYGPWKIDFSMDIGYPLTQHRRSSDTIVYFKVSWQIL